jgi:spoIIIJ-associated protein
MEGLEENVFYGKTVEEATEQGLAALKLTADQAEVEVLDEGKKKLFGGVKAKVKITPKKSDGKRAVEFVDGLFNLLKINVFTELLKDEDDRVEINIQTTNSHTVIGRHGEVLDAIQCIAGAVANIGNEEYKKVVVDCENYRAGREKTLRELAVKLAKKAVEKGRKVTLEPMNPYERRIIHSALADSTEVKTESSGKEPNRFVVIIPNNLKPYERQEKRYGDRQRNSNRGGNFNGRNNSKGGNFRGDKKFGDKQYNSNRGDKRFGDRNNQSNGNRNASRGKKEIHFGAYLGNSGNNNGEE